MTMKQDFTEVEWLVSDVPSEMIAYLNTHFEQVPEEDPALWGPGRKLRLFAAGCCHHVQHLLTDPRSLQALDIIERYVDGQATKAERREAANPAGRVTFDLERETDGRLQAASAVCSALVDIMDEFTDVTQAAKEAAEAATVARSDPERDYDEYQKDKEAEEAYQAQLLRDIFGNPFRPVSFDPAWRTTTVLALAQAAYQERSLPAGTLDVTRLAILADALEDAGCTDADILSHCRNPGPHVRGCWVVDLVLAKQ
jgi:hypothetical protein